MTATATTAVTISSAQVGQGRIPHYIRTDGFHANALCGRRADRVLTEQEAAKASRHCAPCTRALEVITREAQEAAAPTAPAAETTPADVVRPGVVIRKDGGMKWTVERDGHLAVILDEQGMKRGRWAAWSPFARTPHGIAAFTDSAEAAVDAVLATFPVRADVIAREFGVPISDVLAEAAVLEAEWADLGPRAVFAKVPNGRPVALAGAAALTIREALTARAEEAAAEGAAVEEPAPAVTPEWRTLKGLATPFLLYGEERERGHFRPAGDRNQVTGQPLRIVRVWTDRGLRYAEDENGRELYLYGAATKFWTAPTA
jgi:hypothetical protein